MDFFHAKVTESGRLTLPAVWRKRMGLAKGGSVVIEDTDDGLVIRTRAQAVKRAQEWSKKLLAGKPSATVDDFIAEKRREAARENE